MIFFDVMRSDADVLLREAKEFAQQERWVTAQVAGAARGGREARLYAPEWVLVHVGVLPGRAADVRGVRWPPIVGGAEVPRLPCAL
jgi:hypothetical protein